VKLAFVIARKPWYQLFAPIIDAAMARGWDVECWHDYSQPKDGLKGYQFPDADALPEFVNGRPTVRPFRDRSELTSWLADGRVDAVTSIRTPGLPFPADTQRRPILVELQHSIDTFVGQTPQSLLACDVVATYSPWWQRWAEQHYAKYDLVSDRQAYSRDLASHISCVGMPALDAAKRIDPDDVRRRFQIPVGRSVVVLFPFPQGVGQSGFWPRRIFGEPSRLRQLAHVVTQGRFDYLKHVVRGWNDRQVVRAIRAFCDRNGAYLLVKSRMKTPIPGYVEAVADRCVYDESIYPSTILEVLSIASLSIGHFSSAVLESVALNVPHVCIPFSADDYFKDKETDRRSGFTEFFTTTEGDAFQFGGVSSVLRVPDLLSTLAGQPLSNFAMDAEARLRYMRKFLSHDDGNGAARVLQAIEQALATRQTPSTTRAHA